MKILIFNTLYHPSHIGGAEISVQLLAENMVAEGVDVIVVALDEQTQDFYLNGVRVIKWKIKNFYSHFNFKNKTKLKKFFWHILDSCNILYGIKVYSFIKKANPDIVHFNNLSGFSPFIAFVVKLMRKETVYTIRDYYLLCHRATLFNDNTSCRCESLCLSCKYSSKLKLRLIDSNANFVFLSEGQKKRFLNYTQFPNVSIIGNSTRSLVVNNKVPNLTKEYLGLNKLRLGFLGQLSVAKGYYYLLDEFKLLNSAEYELHIGGVASEYNPKQENIFYYGFIDSSLFFQKIDVLIVPSLWDEPFGRVVIEALSANVKVVCSSLGGLSEFAHLKSVKVFDPKPNELQKVLIEMKKNPIFHEVTEIDLSKYTNSFIVKAYLDIYKSLLTIR